MLGSFTKEARIRETQSANQVGRAGNLNPNTNSGLVQSAYMQSVCNLYAIRTQTSYASAGGSSKQFPTHAAGFVSLCGELKLCCTISD